MVWTFFFLSPSFPYLRLGFFKSIVGGCQKSLDVMHVSLSGTASGHLVAVSTNVNIWRHLLPVTVRGPMRSIATLSNGLSTIYPCCAGNLGSLLHCFWKVVHDLTKRVVSCIMPGQENLLQIRFFVASIAMCPAIGMS